jgi:NADH:flavin oxidoreductase / NADH oxidase family
MRSSPATLRRILSCPTWTVSLRNRIVMAPLTRMRAKMPGNIPWELNATYYRQRASAGLIISEATPVSPRGHGYFHTPGIHTTAQADGWKLVTSAVHEAGGKIFLQLWHVGRISHNDFQPNGELPVAPSAISSNGQVPVAPGVLKDCPVPPARPRTSADRCRQNDRLRRNERCQLGERTPLPARQSHGRSGRIPRIQSVSEWSHFGTSFWSIIARRAA